MAVLHCLPFILLGIGLNVFAQLLFKAGMRSIGQFDFSIVNIGPVFQKVMVNPYIYAGLGCYVLSTVLGLIVLSRIDVGVAYPMASLGYIMVALGGAWIFHEQLSMMRLLGIGIIIIGVYLVTRS